MCLGIPGRVVEMVEGYGGQLALVDVLGAERRVNIGMLETAEQDLAPGDWVLIHMGFAVERVDAAGAHRAMAGLEMMGQARESRIRQRFEVRGVVQGVGFRPFVYALASELSLSGTVCNDSAGVVIEVEGEVTDIGEFSRRLEVDAPPLAVVESVDSAQLDLVGGTGFTITDSTVVAGHRTLTAPDVAVCQDCDRELRDPGDRRYRHPFITCTNCGPRFTIIRDLPYDRDNTTMAGFAMCTACAAEYHDPGDRRFHAQPIACLDCGPQLEYLGADGSTAIRESALSSARQAIAAGKIVAVKGLGGYHLTCDASNADAVERLRTRKGRGDKPFAVMVADLPAAQQLVELATTDEPLAAGPRRPILILPRRPSSYTHVCDSVAPGSDDLGLMLAYTGLHSLLLGIDGDGPGPRALVMTSGNRSGEPIVTDDDEAVDRLRPLADGWLRHDRVIEVPCDDSVTRVTAGAELPVRRSRGYAPLPVALPFDVPPMLAVGADLKSTCCVAEGRYAWLSQHIGDMDDASTLAAFTDTERQLEKLTGVHPEQLACDAHPAYRSSSWANRHAQGRRLVRVQHHHAHVASVMGEHGLDGSTQVIGFAFDGTGYGSDEAVWGGEVLLADYKGFRRFAHVAYVPLAGGDASVLRPYRMAMSHLREAGLTWLPDIAAVAACPEDERDVLGHQLSTGFGCVPTSSIGRLFDSVSSLVGACQQVEFEAQAAMALEQLARRGGSPARDGYRFGLASAVGTEPVLAHAAPVIRAVVSDLRAGVTRSVVAARFHAAVVALVVDLAVSARDQTGLRTVALGGGVFQNSLLLSGCVGALEQRGFEVLRPRILPPNDGGLALGQILIAAST